MRKIVLTFVIVMTSFILASCDSLDGQLETSAFSENGKNEVIISSDNLLETAETNGSSQSSGTSEVTSDNDVETSDDFIYLNNSGIFQLTNNDIIWNNFLYGEYSCEMDFVPQTIDVDGERYVELSIAKQKNSQELQNVLGVNPAKKEDDSCYLCPFNSVEDLKFHLRDTYTDKHIAYILSYIQLIEHENSLYISDNGGVFPDREPIDISINEKNDTMVTFSIKYSLPDIEDVFLTVKYEAVYENDKWLINDRINNP